MLAPGCWNVPGPIDSIDTALPFGYPSGAGTADEEAAKPAVDNTPLNLVHCWNGRGCRHLHAGACRFWHPPAHHRSAKERRLAYIQDIDTLDTGFAPSSSPTLGPSCRIDLLAARIDALEAQELRATTATSRHVEQRAHAAQCPLPLASVKFAAIANDINAGWLTAMNTMTHLLARVKVTGYRLRGIAAAAILSVVSCCFFLHSRGRTAIHNSTWGAIAIVVGICAYSDDVFFWSWNWMRRVREQLRHLHRVSAAQRTQPATDGFHKTKTCEGNAEIFNRIAVIEALTIELRAQRYLSPCQYRKHRAIATAKINP